MDWTFRSDQPIYLQLQQHLSESIVNGFYAPGQRMPSVRDIALDAGVNPNTVQRALAELERDGLVDVVDVKCGPLLMGSYRGLPGLLPGYHMNKNHWITILLDGSAEDSLIRELTEISYDLTNTKPRVRSEK